LDYESVHVGVRIDEAGRHHMSFGVDLFLTFSHVFADSRNFIAVDRYVSREGRTARTVNDRSVFDHYIVKHNWISFPWSVNLDAYPTEMVRLSTVWGILALGSRKTCALLSSAPQSSAVTEARRFGSRVL